ncbi:hypothetical protein L596_029636 [Steinernema carpocapsae]|uniref:Uncharacterized protein n=1 Tax=Steinernema carpocapsae TaxID=34508 RepID=A0A4U5LV84_STECR|nr:hypothetical protein L596_029636 [Steinernema carpocapsae]
MLQKHPFRNQFSSISMLKIGHLSQSLSHFSIMSRCPNVDPAMEISGIPIRTGAHTKIGPKLTEIRRMSVDEGKRGMF